MTCFLIEWEEMGGGEQAGVGWGICLTDSLCVASASSFLMPLFASIDQFGNLGRSSQLGLAQGAELAAGLGWHLRPPPSLGGSRELWKAPFPSSGGGSAFFLSWRLEYAGLSPFLSTPPPRVLLAAVLATQP